MSQYRSSTNTVLPSNTVLVIVTIASTGTVVLIYRNHVTFTPAALLRPQLPTASFNPAAAGGTGLAAWRGGRGETGGGWLPPAGVTTRPRPTMGAAARTPPPLTPLANGKRMP